MAHRAVGKITKRLHWPVALTGQFFVVFAVVALSSPGRIDIVDGQTRYEVARSLVDHGDSIIRDKACWFAVYDGRNGEKYTDYRLPQSLLGVLAIVTADATGPVDETRRQFFFSLISPALAACIGVIYAIWFRRLGQGLGASLAWGAAGVFCTPTWYYGTSTFDDILGTSAIVLAVATAWLGRERRPILGAVVAGLAMAWAVNCKPPLVFFTLVVLAAAYRPTVSLRRQFLPAGLVCLSVVLGVIGYKVYHSYKFPPGTTDVFAAYGKLYGSWTTINPLPGLAGLALSPSCGVLWYCPTLFLSWRGWLAWRERQRLFCMAILATSLMFVASISFLPFFKGEPCWGPRYLTPVFAIVWIFVPAALMTVRMEMAKLVLGLGLMVQLLGLSVDPIRLFVQIPLLWNYFNDYPWLVFDANISHLVQRPRELVEVLTPQATPAAEFSPAPLPTHAGCISAAAPPLTSIVGLMASPCAPGPLNGALGVWPTYNLEVPIATQNAVHHYHIFNAPRPWVFSQWYLAEEARPVNLGNSIYLLASLGALGLIMTVVSSRHRLRPSQRDDSPVELIPITPHNTELKGYSAAGLLTHEL
jgi:hypothetical protein